MPVLIQHCVSALRKPAYKTYKHREGDALKPERHKNVSAKIRLIYIA